MFLMSPGAKALMADNTHRFATCWRIDLTNGDTKLFTSHAHKLEYDGDVYLPVTVMSVSAAVAENNLKVSNREAQGAHSRAIDTDLISLDDLRGGRYRDATVTELVLDWRFPSLGPFRRTQYWIADIERDGSIWRAQLEGLAYFLEQQRGGILTRNCPHRLGDANCRRSLVDLTFTGEVTAVVVARRVFSTDITQPRGYFNLGKITFTSGENQGLSEDIKAYAHPGVPGRFFLPRQMPFDIAVGDTFTAIAGCDGNGSTCEVKFANKVNFGGFEDVPGTDFTLQVPDSR